MQLLTATAAMMETDPADTMIRLDRRRSSLGLSSLFEHIVPSSALEHRSSFSQILEDVGVAGGGVPRSPLEEVLADGVPSGAALDALTADPWNVGTGASFNLFLDSGPAKPAARPALLEPAAGEARDDGLATATAPASPTTPTPTAVLRPEALVFDTAPPSPASPVPSLSPSPAAATPPGGSRVGVAHRAGAGGAAGKSGARRPRRQLPNSPAVQAAMPRPPRRGRKDPVIEAAVRGMSPERARLEKNRQSAKECRQRKKEYMANLEAKVVEFERREELRAAELAKVRTQLDQLQRQYHALVGSR